MTWQAWVTVGVTVGVVALVAYGRLATDLVMVAALTVLLAAGILSPQDALAGFANEGAVAGGVLFVVAAGLRMTGAMEGVARRFLGRPRSDLQAQARLCALIPLLSAFIFNTPVVTIMLPVVSDWAKKSGVAASRLMIPLSCLTILGGLGSLIGTSTNLVANSLMVTQTGLPPLGLFEIAKIGVPCVLVGVAYILLFGRCGLPDRQAAVSRDADPRRYTVEMVIEPGSPHTGRTIEDAGLRHLPGLFLVEIDRDGSVLPAVGPEERLQTGDHLVFAGVVESVVELRKMRGLQPATDQIFKLDAPHTQRCLIEAVVSNSCPLVGKTIREGRFRSVYGAAVIAVARNGEHLRQRIGDIVLEPGDTLLLEARSSFAEQHRDSRDFYLVSSVANSAPPRFDRAWVALAILLAMMLLAGTRRLPMITAALLAAGAMILTRCCTATEARKSVDWQIVIVIAASLGIGRAMQTTGAAATLARVLVDSVAGYPWLALAVVYLVTLLFSEVMSHVTAVAIVIPIAVSTAAALEVSVYPFIMAIMVAGSCTFATPISYPTNLMVCGAGGYHFRDFLRFGGPLNVLIGAVTVVLVPWIWPFSA